MTKLAKRMSAEIELGQFDYLSYFPHGSKAEYFRVQHETRSLEVDRDASILFEDYVCPGGHATASPCDAARKYCITVLINTCYLLFGAFS